MIIYPAIDLKDGEVVRLLHGDLEQKTVYEKDPAVAAKRFQDCGFEWLHVVDLDGAVAGAARDHPGIMIVGLIVAVILMGVAANIIAKYIERYRWIAWIGLLVILYVAIKMIWDGFHEVAPYALTMV